MTDFNLKPYITTPENAERIADWLRNRNGIAIWLSEDFSRPGQTMTTPVLQADGQPATSPAWWLGKTPACVITDFADVLISTDVEVKRFHIATRLGDQGLKIKVTDGGSRRIRHEVAKAGEGAFYTFDYSTQEAVIMRSASQVPLSDWLLNHAKPAPTVQ
jgi:hypothetical protein